MGLLGSKKNGAQPDFTRRKPLALVMEILLPNRYHDVTDFEVAVLGYDRRQVQEHLEDLNRRLREARVELDSTAVLHQQLHDAYCEIDRLERRGEPPIEDLPWVERIGRILEAATEQATTIRADAERDAEQVRARALNEALQARRNLEAALQARRERDERLEMLFSLEPAEDLARS